jgi:putative spermidine/putrescine transport system substrate-binding protein
VCSSDLGKASSEQFDVFAVNTAELQRYVRSGVAVPVDIAEIPNVSRQLPRFRDLKNISGLVHGNSVYGIPYTYAEMGLIYDRQQIKEPPTSIDVLWDPRYRGKVLLYNGGSHNFSLAAQTLGTATPFRIGDKEWPATVDKLISLRRNAQGFYSQPDESVNLFKKGRTALMFANYGSQQMKMLTIAGIEVGYTVPVEGALAWLDCWAITSNAKNIKLALAWINFFLGPQAGVALLTRQGLANTTSESPYLRPQDRLKWLEPVEDVDRRNRLWERIIAGDRASKVLAP